MMNLYRRSNSNKCLLAATALVIFLFVADVISGGRIRAEVRALGATISGWAGNVGSGIEGSGIFSTRALLESQIYSLKDQLAHMQERAAGYDVLKTENDQLHALTHLAQNSTGVTAPIVSSVGSSPYGTFLIGAGSSEAITRGSLVVTDGGFVVGTVGDTSPHTSIVAELFAPGASVDAVLDGARVALTGSGAGNASTKVPRGLLVASGDPVFAPGFGERAIGIVGHVASSSGSAAQDVYISLPVNLASLRYVYIISVR